MYKCIYYESERMRRRHCSVRVSNELGAGHPMATSFSVKVVTTLSLMVASIIAVIVMCLRDYISYVFTKGDDVARAVSTMTPAAARRHHRAQRHPARPVWVWYILYSYTVSRFTAWSTPAALAHRQMHKINLVIL